MIKNRNIETIHNRNILALLVYGTKKEYITPQESRLESLLAARIILLLQKKELGRSKISKELGHKQVSGALNKQIKKEN